MLNDWSGVDIPGSIFYIQKCTVRHLTCCVTFAKPIFENRVTKVDSARHLPLKQSVCLPPLCIPVFTVLIVNYRRYHILRPCVTFPSSACTKCPMDLSRATREDHPLASREPDSRRRVLWSDEQTGRRVLLLLVHCFATGAFHILFSKGDSGLKYLAASRCRGPRRLYSISGLPIAVPVQVRWAVQRSR